VSDKSLESLSSAPSSKTTGLPLLAFELAYTFGQSRTQLFFGPSLEDYLRYDLSTIFGLRQEIKGIGLFTLSAQRSPIVTHVWADPYLEGNREDTQRDNRGFRLEWQKIFQSGFELSYKETKVSIDNEQSGSSAALALTEAQQALLDRNGSIEQTTLRYRYRLSDSHGFLLSGHHINSNRDGKAMAHQGNMLEFNYLYQMNDRLWLVNNAVLARFNYDEENPIFNEAADKSRFGLSSSFFYSKPFGLDDWTGNITALYYEESSDIAFFDSSFLMLSVGLLTRF
jgi:hypothetical protein